jgi:hypothetical protein
MYAKYMAAPLGKKSWWHPQQYYLSWVKKVKISLLQAMEAHRVARG